MEKKTKADLVEKIREQSKIDQKDISNIIDLLFSEIKDSLIKGNIIELRGFGTFKTKYSERTKGRNPKTGEVVELQPHYKATFLPGKELQEELAAIKQDEE